MRMCWSPPVHEDRCRCSRHQAFAGSLRLHRRSRHTGCRRLDTLFRSSIGREPDLRFTHTGSVSCIPTRASLVPRVLSIKCRLFAECVGKSSCDVVPGHHGRFEVAYRIAIPTAACLGRRDCPSEDPSLSLPLRYNCANHEVLEGRYRREIRRASLLHLHGPGPVPKMSLFADADAMHAFTVRGDLTVSARPLAASWPTFCRNSSTPKSSDKDDHAEGRCRIPIARPTLPDPIAFAAALNEIWQSGKVSNFGPFVERSGAPRRPCDRSSWHARSCFVRHRTRARMAALGLSDGGSDRAQLHVLFDRQCSYAGTNLTPVFARYRRRDAVCRSDDVRRRITSRTVAIAAVHTFGCPAPIDALETLARDYGLKLVFDAAHGSELVIAATTRVFGDAFHL